MGSSRLEHVNVTVKDPDAVAGVLVDLFGWHIRWSGDAMQVGRTVHVGTDDSYVALYSQGGTDAMGNTYKTPGGLNHIGVVVADIDATEAQVKAAGFTPTNHGDYEPGHRFYFDGPDGIEIEVVAYP